MKKLTIYILSLSLLFIPLYIKVNANTKDDIIYDIVNTDDISKYQIGFKINEIERIKKIQVKVWSLSKGKDSAITYYPEFDGVHYMITLNKTDLSDETDKYVWQAQVEYKVGNVSVSDDYEFNYVEGNNLSTSEENDNLLFAEEAFEKTANFMNNIQVFHNMNSYTITATIDTQKIAYVSFPTWTTNNGQDDLTWENGTIIGNKISYTVNIKDHNYEEGEYLTHIYAYDEYGTTIDVQGVSPQILNKVMPSITNVTIDNNGTSYTVNAKIIGDNITDVKFPTWTTKNGQDDVRWDSGSISGNTVTYTVDMKDHNYEEGEYITHIYAYDALGNVGVVGVEMQALKKMMPAIRDIEVENTGTKYKITASVNGVNITDVKFPTWTTKNGQDDVRWDSGSISGNTVTYTVDMKDHEYEEGEYITHIYAYDALGNVSVVALDTQELKKIVPKISDIKVENTGTKYKITASVNGMNITDVKFPTWTTKNGQDDVRWDSGSISGNTVTYTVDMKDHNYEEGEYITHIYAYDALGSVSAVALDTQELKKIVPTLSNIKVESTGTQYKITALINGMNISDVKFPTWTLKNGQDDVRWDSGIINGNTVTYTVDMKDHNYEDGQYITHIYAYDISGEVTSAAVPTQVLENKAPVIQNVKVTNNGQYYTITATITDDLGLDYVQFPTWTLNNGQDDITWEKGNVNGNTVSYTVYPKDHNYEIGTYRTHIYAYDKLGKRTVLAVDDQTIITIPEMSPGWNVVNGKKYLMNNQGKVVAGANKLVIDISEHNGTIDWQAVKNAGVDAVILRCGYGWTNNNSQMDATFLRNALELERLNIPYGVYLFSYETSAAGAIEEAKYTLKLIQGRKISLPVYYDLEYDKIVGDLSQSTYVAMAKAYCEYIKQAGYTPGIYANLNYWQNKLNDSSLDVYTKWVAQYNANDGSVGHCDYTKPYKMWQYTSVGKVSGISTNVDMNAMYN